MPELNKMMLVEQVAEKYGLTIFAIYKAIYANRIPYYRIGDNSNEPADPKAKKKRGTVAIYSEDAAAYWGNGKHKPGPKGKDNQ